MIKKEKEDVPSSLEMRSPDQINAFIGRGSEFEGKLTFTGTVRIDGKFTGEVLSKDVLVIGDGAKVKADIEVGTIITSGEVVGNIRALNKVEILAPGRVHGSIISPVLVVEEGVIFQGNCQMDETHSRREDSPPPSEPAPSPVTPLRREPESK